MDNWKHRSKNMRCRTCMYFVAKPLIKKEPHPLDDVEYLPDKNPPIGRCRKNAPTLDGWPPVFETDWCGQHKLDEEKM